MKQMHQLFQELNDAKVPASWLATTRGIVRAHMRANPSTVSAFRIPLLAPLRFFISMPAIAAVLIIILSGGTAWAAEGSLPGDALYAVKLHANERAFALLQFDDESKARWHFEVVARRLKEFTALSGKKNGERLVVAHEQELHIGIARASDAVREAAERLEKKGNDREKASEILLELSATLDVYQHILAVHKHKAAHAPFIALLAAEEEESDDALEAAEELGEEKDRELSGEGLRYRAEGKLGAASQKIAEVERFFANLTKHEKEIPAAAQEKLKEAKDLFAKAKASFEANAYDEAFVGAKASMKAAIEAKVLAKGAQSEEDSHEDSNGNSSLQDASQEQVGSAAAGDDDINDAEQKDEDTDKKGERDGHGLGNDNDAIHGNVNINAAVREDFGIHNGILELRHEGGIGAGSGQ